MGQRKYICFDKDMKQKINSYIDFVNRYRWKNTNRESLIKLMYTLETLLYSDYNRPMAINNFKIETFNVRHFYDEVKHLMPKDVKKNVLNCVEYFEAVVVALELSKGGQ